MQAFFNDMKERTAEALREFGQEVVQQVLASCTAALADFDDRLCGIRDGIVADDAADKRTKVRKCAPTLPTLPFPNLNATP
jgi:hypothetical protein